MRSDDAARLPVRPLHSPGDVVAATGGHPVAVLDVGDGDRPRGFAVGGADGTDEADAVVVSRGSDHGVPGVAVLGDGAAYEALLTHDTVREWLAGNGFRHVSAPRQRFGVLRAHLALDPERGGDWDWMWTDTPPPPVPAEERVVTLRADARDDLVAFLDLASPRTHGQPFARPGQVWVGIRDGGGAVLACGGSEPSEGGTPTLAGIAVHPAHRGAGLGAAVTAALTRRAVEEVGACALGMFADNDVARRLYHRLGYTTGMEWHSGWFAQPRGAHLPRRRPPA